MKCQKNFYFQILFSGILIFPCWSGVFAMPDADSQAFRTTNYQEAAAILFKGKKILENDSSVSIYSGEFHLPHIWGGNNIPVKVHSKKNISRMAIMIEPDHTKPEPHGLIDSRRLKSVLAYYEFSENVWPAFNTSFLLSHPSTVHIYVETPVGVIHHKRYVMFYYRTAGDWEAHGQSAERCRFFEKEKELDFAKLEKPSLISRRKVFQNFSESIFILKYYDISGDWWGKNCMEKIPLYVNRFEVYSGEIPIIQAYSGAIERNIIFQFREINAADKIRVEYQTTIGEHYSAKMENKTDETVLRSLLHSAASIGDSEYIRKLLEAGVDVNIEDETNNYSPLSRAAESGNTDAIQTLLDSGANINSHSPLLYAAKNGRTEAVQLLLNRGASKILFCERVYPYGKKDLCGTTVLREIKKLRKGKGMHWRNADMFHLEYLKIEKLLKE